jgi:5,5'-dehydrodivanillate O-demethylase
MPAVNTRTSFARVPGTLAGRYLRRIWQPVYHSADIEPGSAKPLRIMGETLALYRGASGALHLVDGLCPHRGTRLSAGRVEGDAIRCFYHGWKFDAAGQCVEQPAEESRFCAKVRIRSYPCANTSASCSLSGRGAPPAFPLYPEFECFEGLLEIDSYQRACNYYQNLENALDMSHVGFVHGDNVAAFSGHRPRTLAERRGKRLGRGVQLPARKGRAAAHQPLRHAEHLPYVRAAQRPGNPLAGVAVLVGADRRRLAHAVQPAPRARRRARRSSGSARDARHGAARSTSRTSVWPRTSWRAGSACARWIPKRCDLVRLQDDIAQIGQGRIADRSKDRPVLPMSGVIALRKLWQRELQAFAQGEGDQGLAAQRRHGSFGVGPAWRPGGRAQGRDRRRAAARRGGLAVAGARGPAMNAAAPVPARC